MNTNNPLKNRHLIDDAFDWKNANFTLKPLITHDGAPVVSEGELTIIAGAKKTYKSHIAYSIALAAMGAPCVGFESVMSSYSPSKVAIIDTEQPSSRLAHNIRKMSTLVKDIDTHIVIRHWKGETPAMMYECLPALIEKYKPKIVILDGIADFVADINSIIESHQVVDMLQHCAEAYSCAIIVIIHYNPSTKKERGHLGTILANKTDGYISLTRKTEGRVLVAADDSSRGEPFKPFEIIYDSSADWIVYFNSASSSASPSYEALAREIPSIINASPNFQADRKKIVNSLSAKYAIPKGNITSIDRAIKHAIKYNLITQERPRAPYKLIH